MRIRCFLLSVLFCVAGLSAQDVITKTDGTKLDAKVEEITDTSIRYRKASNPTGPIYNIPISSVASILYQNGTTEKFTSDTNVAQPIYTKPQLSPSVSDEELLKMSVYNPQELYAKAKMYRKIGWIGGGVILGTGIALGITAWAYNPEDDGTLNFIYGAGPGLGAAAIWCLGWNLGAKSLIKKARMAEIYSATIIGDEICRFGDKSLIAGVNVMGNQMTRTHGLGLSLSLNF